MGKIIRNGNEISTTKVILDNSQEIALLSCVDDEDIQIPEGITNLKPYAYAYSNIKNAVLPSSLKRIGYKGRGASESDGSCYTFYKSRIETLDLSKVSDEIKIFGLHGLCYDCKYLHTVKGYFPQEHVIFSDSFYYCVNLVNFDMPRNVYIIGSNAFRHCELIDFTNESLANITGIDTYGFADCKNLSITKLPELLNTISGYAFSHCSSIGIKSIPPLITLIPSGVFYECTNLTQMNFEGDISTLYNNSFYNTVITKFTFPNNTVVPTLVNCNSFPNDTNYDGQIAVPNELYDTWITSTNWVRFTNAHWIRLIDNWSDEITVEGDYALKSDTDLNDVRHLSPSVTYYFNDNLDVSDYMLPKTFDVNFTSNGSSFTQIEIADYGSTGLGMEYHTERSFYIAYSEKDMGTLEPMGWSEDYRTITFETKPTGELLEFLEKNAVEVTL